MSEVKLHLFVDKLLERPPRVIRALKRETEIVLTPTSNVVLWKQLKKLSEIEERSPRTLESLFPFFVYCPDAPSARLSANEFEFVARAHDVRYLCERLGIDAVADVSFSPGTKIYFYCI